MKSGYDLGVICVISEVVNVLVIVFGGVGNLEYLVVGIFEGKVDVVFVVSIFYFGEYIVLEVKVYLVSCGIVVC